MKNKEQKIAINKNVRELNKTKEEFKKISQMGKKRIMNLPHFEITHTTNYIEDSIPFLEMDDEGICVLGKDLYSKSLMFFELNYRLSILETQEKIAERYKKLLNSFSPKVSYQLSFINFLGKQEKLKKALTLEQKFDDLQPIREEFQQMLNRQMEKGKNKLKHIKLLTFTVKAEDRNQAKQMLFNIESTLKKMFKKMGVQTKSLSAYERCEILHDCLNPNQSFIFDACKSLKDNTLPNYLSFKKNNYFQINEQIGTTRLLKIDGTELEDDVLESILENQKNLMFTIHIKPNSQVEALKKITGKNLDVNTMILDSQKKATQNGYDLNLIPEKLKVFSEDIQVILDFLRKNEKLFTTTTMVTLFDATQEKVDLTLSSIEDDISSNFCSLQKLEHQQEEALYSVLPLGINFIHPILARDLVTESVRVFMPFSNQDILEDSKRSFYYGINKMTQKLIMGDRTKLKNPNGLYLGTPGSGKSFAAKREIVNAILTTDDDIIICDPEGEYAPMLSALGGVRIDLSNESEYFLNPLDLNLNYGDGKNPLKEKADFILSFMQVIRGKKEITATERTIIDRCVPRIYESFLKNPIEENLPILEDLYLELLTEGEIGKFLASELELYVYGSLNLFNHQTNVEKNKRIICYDFKNLASNLRELAMFIVLEQVWNKISQNRGEKFTQAFFDEFHELLANPLTSKYVVKIWKRFRKWGGIPTGMTQNMTDMLVDNIENIASIFSNTDFILLLNQKGQDREILQDFLDLSDEQVDYITDSDSGHGLIIYNGVVLPFEDNFPKNTTLYKVMNTKASDNIEDKKSN